MINVTKAYLPDREKYKSYVDQIFDSGRLTNSGWQSLELERRLKEYLGVENLVLVSNGTLALQIAYKVLGLRGDVLTTPFSFVATTSTLVWEGLQPIFVDIDKELLTLDPSQIEKQITPNTTAIVATHVFGNACDIEQIEWVANRHNLKVIYDAAHAFGVNYDGSSILNYGDASTISFHSTKLFHTIEGGAIVFKDAEMYQRAKRAINFGIMSETEINGLGINSKLNEFQSAMGLCVLDDMDKIFDQRKERYEFYINELSNIKNLGYQKRNEQSTNNFSYFPVLFENEEVLLKVVKELNQNDIYPRRYFCPSLDTLSYLVHKQVMNISNDVSKRILCLPFYESLEQKDQQKIVGIIKKIVEC